MIPFYPLEPKWVFPRFSNPQQQHGGLYNREQYYMTPSNRRMYNAYAEPQNYLDYDYMDYQSVSVAME